MVNNSRHINFTSMAMINILMTEQNKDNEIQFTTTINNMAYSSVTHTFTYDNSNNAQSKKKSLFKLVQLLEI